MAAVGPRATHDRAPLTRSTTGVAGQVPLNRICKADFGAVGILELARLADDSPVRAGPLSWKVYGAENGPDGPVT